MENHFPGRRYIQKKGGISSNGININIDQQIISKIENNSRIVTDYELVYCYKILGIDVKEMLQKLNDISDKQKVVQLKIFLPDKKNCFVYTTYNTIQITRE